MRERETKTTKQNLLVKGGEGLVHSSLAPPKRAPAVAPAVHAPTRLEVPMPSFPEPWLAALLAAHAALLAAVVAARDCTPFQLAVLATGLAVVAGGRAANAAAAGGAWRGAPYFDAGGAFYAGVVAGPLLVTMAVQLVRGRGREGTRARVAGERETRRMNGDKTQNKTKQNTHTHTQKPPGPLPPCLQILQLHTAWHLMVRLKVAQIKHRARQQQRGARKAE